MVVVVEWRAVITNSYGSSFDVTSVLWSNVIWDNISLDQAFCEPSDVGASSDIVSRKSKHKFKLRFISQY